MAEQKEDKKSFFQRYIYRGDKRLFWSYLAIVLGILTLGSAVVNPQPSMLETGWAIIFGALAYRSAQKRKLALVKGTKLRIVLEIIAITSAILVIITQNEFGMLLVNYPFGNLVVPIWILIAYIFVNIKNYNLVKDN